MSETREKEQVKQENTEQALLTVQDLHVYYGAIHAIKGVSFNVKRGEVVCLIGANGAGKTTTLQTISGLLTPREGSILYEGEEIRSMPAHKILRKGIAQVPEGRRMGGELSVEDNLDMGAFTLNDPALREKRKEAAFEQFPRLRERRNQRGATLSGGEQQMLAMARALMTDPKLLLLDEPSMGLSPVLTNEVFQIIHDVAKRGTTVLLVEQNARMALQVAQRAYVLETGRIVMEGSAETLQNNPKIKAAYLGG